MRGHVSCTIEQYKVHDEFGGVENKKSSLSEKLFRQFYGLKLRNYYPVC